MKKALAICFALLIAGFVARGVFAEVTIVDRGLDRHQPTVGYTITTSSGTAIEPAGAYKTQLEKDREEGRVWNYPRTDTVMSYVGFRANTDLQSDAAYKELVTWLDGAAASGVVPLYTIEDIDISAISLLTQTPVDWVNTTAWATAETPYLDLFTVTSLVTDVTDGTSSNLLWVGDLSQKGTIINPFIMGANDITTVYYLTLPEINPRTINITTTSRPRP